MSIRWMTKVFASQGPRGANRLMLVALADNANDEGVCWPSISTLAKKCAVKPRAAQRTVHRLVEGGYISRDERPGKSTVYELHEEALTPVVDDPPVADDTPDANDTPTPVADDTPPPSPTTPEPSENHHLNQQHALSARAREASEEEAGGDVFDAAASLKEEHDAAAVLVEDLQDVGVDEPVARQLVASYEHAHIEAMLDRGEEDAEGPGWYVAAIRNGYAGRTGTGGRDLLSYQEALAVFEHMPGDLTDHFEPVKQPDGTTWFRRISS